MRSAIRRALGPARRAVRQIGDPRSWGAAGRILSPPATVLMYHRVTELDHDIHHLAVSPDRFRAQMQWLADHMTPMTVTELVRSSRAGRLPSHAVAVTLDDGYADNLENAVPILEATGVPATLFIVTEAIDASQEYWWDLLEHRVMVEGRGMLHVVIDGTDHEWDLDDARQRRDAHDHIHRHLLLGDDRQREAMLASLGPPGDQQRVSHRTMTWGQLEEAASRDIIEIGAHTRSHPSMLRLPVERQRREILDGVSWLAERLGDRPPAFSFPHGHYTVEALDVLRTEGIEAAVTTDPVPWRRGDDPLRIGRLAVEDWPLETFIGQIGRFRRAG